MIARRRLAGALVVLATLLLPAATLAAYAGVTLVGSDQFAARAAAGLNDPDVRSLIANRVTDDVILRHQADLVSARPLISAAIASVVGSDAFTSLFRRGVLDAHRAVVNRDDDTLTLTLADVGTVLAAALEQVRPSVAAEVRDTEAVSLLTRRAGALGDIARRAERVRVLAAALVVLALAAATAAVAVSTDRRRTVASLGMGAVAAGLVVVMAYTVARAVVLGRVEGVEQRAAAAAIWHAYLADLRSWGWALVGAGAVAAAAASSLLPPVAVEGALRAAWARAVAEPVRPAARVVRALGLIAAGVLMVVQPAAVLQAVATLAGAYLVYRGVVALLRLLYRPQVAPAMRARRIAVPAVAVVLVGVIGVALVAGGGAGAAAAGVATCDGSAELCDRPLDDVVLPATHNSMSAPLTGWYATQQDAGIAAQLADGIRGLLIDTHYADRLADGRVRTYFASADDLAAAVKQDGVSTESYKAALRLRERIGFRGPGTRGLYLCHTFCELGATPLADSLTEIHDFLVMHPGEIVVVINQDYVTPADFVQAVDSAGLSRYAFTPPAAGSWPTLRELIDADRRLVILAEHEAGVAAWYQLVYRRLVEETPFSFSTPAQIADTAASCKPNRGPEGAPLFLLNHWVTTDPTPRPSNAEQVNASAALLRRVRACERMRDHLPNLVAVDFYRRGDLFDVVKTLNGL